MSDPRANVVESGLRLSQSFIWKLQCQFYETLGIEAWLSGVIPSKITTNAFIARAYARMIAGYAADVDAEQLTIVELGAGHGRFGFLVAQHLRELAATGLFETRSWRYVLTDVAERNIDFWQRHEAFEPLVADGLVDFARYEAGVDSEIHLRCSGECLSAQERIGHLVVIGNYFFDSLPIDVFQVSGEQLFECLPRISVSSDISGASTRDPAILEHLELDWQRELAATGPYGRTELDRIVSHFRQSLGEAAFTIPVGAFDTLETLGKWSANGYLLLAADKGYTREEDLRGRPLPTMVRHGCFSFSVNFCALAKWIEGRGGATLLPSYSDAAIEVAAYTSGAVRRGLRAAFDEGVAAFSPGDFHEITRRCGRDGAEAELRQCLSLIRLSGYEPQLLHALRRTIRAEAATATGSDCRAIRDVLSRVAENYFQLGDDDIPFVMASIYQQMEDYGQAEQYYRDSLRLFGEHPSTMLNLARCVLQQGRPREALQLATRSLVADPESAAAEELKQLIERDIEPSSAAVQV